MTNYKLLQIQILLVLLSAGLVSPSYAQNKDFQIWTGVSVQKEFTKKIQIGLEEQIRLSENATTISQYFTELTAGYKINKHISIAGNYRFIQKDELSVFETVHRLSFDFELTQKISRITLSLRPRFQQEFYPAWFYYENPLDPTQYLRNKLALEAKIVKKLSLYFDSELYYQLNNPTGNVFDKVRYETGLQYKINKKNSINGFYMIQKQLNVSKADTDYVLGINYKIKI